MSAGGRGIPGDWGAKEHDEYVEDGGNRKS